MAENEAAGVAEKEQAFEYPVTVEDLGPGSKRISVEIPQERIAAKLAEQFKELRQQAALPGFRPGHAPQKLIEKRFSSDVKEQVRRSLISESYEHAVQKNSLQVIGEPEFDNPDSIQLPEGGSLTYSFHVEVQPEFTLPDLSSLKVRKPKIEIKEENVEQAMNNLREQQGTLVPVEDRGVTAKDYLIADVHLKVAGSVVNHQHDAQIVARPARIGGIQVDDLAEKLEGMKPAETRTIDLKVPDTYADESMRGQDAQLEIALKDIKRMELAEVTPEFLSDLGFQNESELREALREQMAEKIDYDVKQAMRKQVSDFLLENVKLELPAKLSDRQADRLVQRRAMEMAMRGVPQEQIAASVEQLRSGARDEAIRELKVFFILQKIAAEQNVDTDEAELNGRVAMIAAQRGRRPEKVKQEMSKDGSLTNLYVQIREQKAIDKLLESAQIEEVDVQEDDKNTTT